MRLPKYLGGHLNKTHLDQGTLNYVIEHYHIKSFLDVGCGPGGMVELANSKGLDCLGVDGDFTLKRFDNTKFIIHDYTSGPLSLDKNYDFCWSCEFVEHVEEKFIDNFMTTISSANYVLITHAPPGTPGHHHVNCQNAEYWVNIFEKYNYKFDLEVTKTIRQISTMTKKFIQKNGLFFIKN
jgi:SAM-dependent methyltransferase